MNADDERTEPATGSRNILASLSWPVIVLSAATAVVVVAGIVLTGVTVLLVGSREDLLAEANMRRRAQTEAQEALSEKRRQEYAKADLPGLYAEVLGRNQKQREAADGWLKGDPTWDASMFTTWKRLQLSCEDSLIAYDYSASKYKDLVRSDPSRPLPLSVDRSDPLLNCWMI